MVNLAPEQQLDTVLDILKEHKPGLKIVTIGDIVWENKVKFEYEELERILKKLNKDGYVTIGEDGQFTDIYSISFEGYFFKGYVEQKRINDLKDKYLETAERLRRRNEAWVAYGTWFAGLVGLAVLAWYVYQYFYPAL